jgi:hypothetical protein
MLCCQDIGRAGEKKVQINSGLWVTGEATDTDANEDPTDFDFGNLLADVY